MTKFGTISHDKDARVVRSRASYAPGITDVGGRLYCRCRVCGIHSDECPFTCN